MNTNQKITVEAADIEGVAAALGMELIQEQATEEETEYPAQLYDVLDTLADIYGGVQVATENDSRGRSRKMVRQYADREDLSSDDVGTSLGYSKATTSSFRTATGGGFPRLTSNLRSL